VPFQPVAGLHGSDLPTATGLQTVRDPYSGVEVYVVPAIQPDWAVLHVHEADALGNARIYGSVFWDRLMSRAARGVILTAERIVPTAELARQPELTVIPALLVRAVVAAPGGALPCSCAPDYDIDRASVEAYLAACADPAALAAYLAAQDRALRGTPTPAGRSAAR
jgi:glutaconate CoA-transferase, subunit A